MLRLSLVQFLFLTTALGLFGGWLGTRWLGRRDRLDAIHRIYDRDGIIVFDHGEALGRNSSVSVMLADVDATWQATQICFGSRDKPGINDDLRSLLHLPEVECVDLYGRGFSRDGLPYLARMDRLSWLTLSDTSITASDLSEYSRFADLPRLSLVNIEDSTIAGIDKLKGLEQLQIISSPRFRDSGLEHLKGLRNLRRLGVYRTPIDGSGLQHLIALRQLRILRLNGTNVDAAAIPILMRLRHLETLDIADTLIDKAGVNVLRKTLHQCEITY